MAAFKCYNCGENIAGFGCLNGLSSFKQPKACDVFVAVVALEGSCLISVMRCAPSSRGALGGQTLCVVQFVTRSFGMCDSKSATCSK